MLQLGNLGDQSCSFGAEADGRLKIGVNAVLQVFGFTDVENFPGGVFVDVDSRTRRQKPPR